MHQKGNREITVKKKDLIERIAANKERHIQQFEAAKIAYKKEALRQLEELRQKVENGDLDIKLNLVSPQDVSKKYDEKSEMFEWEIADEVTLTQDEFKDYVQDNFDFARSAFFSNQSYLGG